MKQLTSAEAAAEKALAEAQVRERQVKKLQLKIDEEIKKYDDINTMLNKVSKEKQDYQFENSELERKLGDSERELLDTQTILE